MNDLMKRPVLVLLAATLLSGCAPNVKMSIDAMPDDSAIYVDGEHAGNGHVLVDVGPEYGWRKSYVVEVKHAGFRPLREEIASEPDYRAVSFWTAWLAYMSAMDVIWYLIDHTHSPGGALAFVLMVPFVPWYNNTFKKSYTLDLRAPDAVEAPSSNAQKDLQAPPLETQDERRKRLLDQMNTP